MPFIGKFKNFFLFFQRLTNIYRRLYNIEKE